MQLRAERIEEPVRGRDHPEWLPLPSTTTSRRSAKDALHAAYADREQARRDRYAARQAHERASAVVERLQRRVSELTDRLAKMPRRSGVTRKGLGLITCVGTHYRTGFRILESWGKRSHGHRRW